MQDQRPRCGVCTALAAIFRRIMCIAPSRRGSHESYYHHVSSDPGAGTNTLDTSDHSTVFVRLTDVWNKEREEGRRRLSAEEVVLLEALEGGGGLRAQGRFLTMHKRRRKRLTTRAIQEAPALLDDIHHGQVECVLSRVWQWPFNAFTLDTATGGRSLPVLCVHLFHWYGLMDHFNLDVVRIWKFFSLVEEGYHSTNPYHNAIHATDVTQAMHCFLQEDKIKEHLTPLEIMSALIAAVTHDLDHPGVNQPFLIATSNHLAALYENTSVLENHHWRSAIGCLLESHVAEQLAEVRPELERQISSLILATDITRQQEFLTKFKKYLDDKTLDMRRPEDRHFILQIALKCADISNPCRPWDVSRKWSQKVCEEFFRQGDYERQLNLPVTSLCDRQSTSVPKIQAGFFRFVVAPLFEEWHRFLDTGLSHSMMGYLRSNQAKWEAMIQQELAEETRTEISEAEEIPDEVEGEAAREGEEDAPRRISLPGPPQLTVPPESDKVTRRHSVPISNKRTLTIPCTIIRRESVDAADPRRRFTLGPILHLEEDEEISLVSSCSSSGLQRSSGGSHSGGEERPVSAENLLPDLSIATITSCSDAGRLATVLHGCGGSASLAPPTARLTRQQTFPPIQPYIRVRYMSTTAEMHGSVSSSSSSSSDSSAHSVSRTFCDSANKDSDASSDKGAKSKCREKENVDPDSSKPKRTLPQMSLGLCRRRGSAPVGAHNGGESGGQVRAGRRGSVPADTSLLRQSVLKPLGFKENSTASRRPSLQQETLRPNHSQGSVEGEEGVKGRGLKKKVLRRRSSGGPETFASGHLSNSTFRRRGSLPLEALSSTTPGRSNSFKEIMRH